MKTLHGVLIVIVHSIIFSEYVPALFDATGDNENLMLTCADSPALDTLKSLGAQGGKILTCGTCLDYYGLTEKLAVGEVTNMYSIAETLAGAGKVIKP